MASRFIRSLMVFPILIFLLTACASQQDVVYLHNEVNALNRKTQKDLDSLSKALRKLEEQINANEARQKEIEKDIGNTLKEDQESLRLNVAQLEADLVEMRDTIQTLTGRVEETGHLLKRTVEKDTTKQDVLVSQVTRLSSTVEDLAARMERLERQEIPEKIPSKKKPQTEAGKTKGGAQRTELAFYEKTLGYYWDGRYDEAITGFNKFLTSYPKSDLADNAYFWIGECHRAAEEYEEAILAYQKVINNYPRGNKVPAAMLHQALAFEKIDDKTTATLVYKKLLRKFPKTREAEIAKKRLKHR
jgi:tol-pal system protein YbgF